MLKLPSCEQLHVEMLGGGELDGTKIREVEVCINHVKIKPIAVRRSCVFLTCYDVVLVTNTSLVKSAG